jgi:hypothetical protein
MISQVSTIFLPSTGFPAGLIPPSGGVNPLDRMG